MISFIKLQMLLVNIELLKDITGVTYDVENDLGGLNNITNQSEIPNRSVAFEIN